MKPTDPSLPIDPADVLAAAERLRGVATRTPVLTSRTLDRLTGARVLLKAESFQRSGSFKFRGAYNALSCLPPDLRARGVLTYSSGNHAGALALAAQLFRTRCTVIMPDDAPAVKQAAARGYGAEVILYDRRTTTREALGQEIAAARGLPLIPPYDHPDVAAGQGTAALELLEDHGPLDALLVPCGGGGLLAGSALAAQATAPSCERIIGAEPELADDAARSFYSGTLQQVHNPPTIADGARTPSLGAVTFPIVLACADAMATVSETGILRAMQFLWERMKLVVEPTGCLGLAALLEGSAPVAPGARVGVILSGGNVDAVAAGALLARLGAEG